MSPFDLLTQSHRVSSVDPVSGSDGFANGLDLVASPSSESSMFRDPGPTESARAKNGVIPSAVLEADSPAVGWQDIRDPRPSDIASDPTSTIERLAVGRSPGVRGTDQWAEAGRKVLRFHLARIVARVLGVLAGEDTEDVHAMRVAARRMRAAWRVFGDGFERAASRKYRDDLRAIGGRLGAVRDLDVLLAILASYAESRSARGRAGLAPLVGAWSTERDARRAELVTMLTSAEFRQFVDEYVELVTTELASPPSSPSSPVLVRTRIGSAAWGAYEAVWAFDSVVGDADLATLHQLRIAGKWLRYTLEFVREPLEPEAPRLIRPVVTLQDHLGAQHDLHVAATLARDFAASAPALTGHEQRSIERFVHTMDAGVVRLGSSFGRTWRSVVEPAYRLRLGRGLARL